jgi:hypothetical protein
MLATHGIRNEVIRHLYNGDLAGLLLALMPLHEGKAEEIQARAVDEFDSCRKQGFSYMQFTMQFTERLDIMVAVGITLPDVYIRLKFIRAMKTDAKYASAMVTLLSQRPVLDLPKLQLKLQGYADTLRDNHLGSTNEACLSDNFTSSDTSTATTSAAAKKKAAKKAADKAKKLAKRAAEKMQSSSTNAEALATNANTSRGEKPKPLCFAYLDGKTCTRKNCNFRHDGSDKEKLAAKRMNQAKPCLSMVHNNVCPRDPDCRFSHDPDVLDKARAQGLLSQAQLVTGGRPPIFYPQGVSNYTPENPDSQGENTALLSQTRVCRSQGHSLHQKGRGDGDRSIPDTFLAQISGIDTEPLQLLSSCDVNDVPNLRFKARICANGLSALSSSTLATASGFQFQPLWKEASKTIFEEGLDAENSVALSATEESVTTRLSSEQHESAGCLTKAYPNNSLGDGPHFFAKESERNGLPQITEVETPYFFASVPHLVHPSYFGDEQPLLVYYPSDVSDSCSCDSSDEEEFAAIQEQRRLQRRRKQSSLLPSLVKVEPSTKEISAATDPVVTELARTNYGRREDGSRRHGKDPVDDNDLEGRVPRTPPRRSRRVRERRKRGSDDDEDPEDEESLSLSACRGCPHPHCSECLPCNTQLILNQRGLWSCPVRNCTFEATTPYCDTVSTNSDQQTRPVSSSSAIAFDYSSPVTTSRSRMPRDEVNTSPLPAFDVSRLRATSPERERLRRKRPILDLTRKRPIPTVDLTIDSDGDGDDLAAASQAGGGEFRPLDTDNNLGYVQQSSRQGRRSGRVSSGGRTHYRARHMELSQLYGPDMVNNNITEDLPPEDPPRREQAIRPLTREQEQAISPKGKHRGDDDTDKPAKPYALMAHNDSSSSSGCVDSGATWHYVPMTTFFMNCMLPGSKEDTSIMIYTAGATPLQGICRGTFIIIDPAFNVPIHLRKVVLVKGLRRPLISITALTETGYLVVFAGTRCMMLTPEDNTGCLLLDRRTEQGLTSLFEVPLSYFSTDFEASALIASTYPGSDSYLTWHRRMGHLHPRKLHRVLPNKFTAKQADSACACHDCIAAKIHKAVFPRTNSFRAPFAGHSTSLDWAGPFRVRSPFGHRYFALFMDVCSKKKKIRLSKRKSEIDEFIMDYINMVERQQQPRKVVCLISDGAINITATRAKLRRLGISVLVIAPNSSRLNLVERAHRTVAEGARSMMSTAGLPPSLFLLACKAMVEVDNRVFKQTEICAPDGRPLTPLELFDGRVRESASALLACLRVFGSECWALQHTDKQVTKSERCIMLGFADDNPKSYFLMSLERKRYFSSRDVVGDEVSFPFKVALQISRIIPTRYEQGDEGESDGEAFQDGIQPDPGDGLELFDIPDDTESTQQHADTLSEAEVSPQDHAAGPSPQPEPTTQTASTVHEEKRINKRLSFSSAAPSPVLRDLFATSSKDSSTPTLETVQEDEERIRLGTGDESPATRTSPAKFQEGSLYETKWGQPARIIRNNDDGDVQVTFPEDPDDDHDKQYTVAKDLILGLRKADEALNVDQGQRSMNTILRSPLDWVPATYDGLLVPSCEFCLLDEEIFTLDTAEKHYLAQQHGGFSGKTDFHVALYTKEDLVGKVLADDLDIPKYHFQIKNHPLRQLIEQAMKAEFDALVRIGVFGQGKPKLAGDDSIGTMFVLKAKSDDNGMLAKIKARLTVLGNQEVNVLLTYSPVMMLTTMRLLISLHTADLEVTFWALDITAAFVSAKAVREIWVRLPAGFVPPGGQPGWVYPLIYNLYGTVDAPRAFYLDYFEWHRSIGFTSIHEDQCYLSIHKGEDFIKFVTHVDDSVVAQKGKKLWDWYLAKLRSKYEFTLNLLSYALGMRFQRDPKTGAMTIDQDAQVDKMLRAFNLTGKTRKASTPVASDQGKIRPSKADLPQTPEAKAAALRIPYRQAVGHLGFLQQTSRFEITYALKIASSFLQEWGPRCWEWVKHIMRYLKSKQHRKFVIKGGSVDKLLLKAYSDADHITDVDNRRSISAYFILCGEDIIAWHASFQTIVSHSSSESELMALDLVVRRVQALRWLFDKLGGLVNEPTTVYVDCSSAITMAENPVQNHRNCHIHARFFYVRDLIREAVIQLGKVDTSVQLADLLCTFKSVANFYNLMAIAKPQ